MEAERLLLHLERIVGQLKEPAVAKALERREIPEFPGSDSTSPHTRRPRTHVWPGFFEPGDRYQAHGTETRIQGLLESISMPAAVCDHEGCIVVLNAAMQDLIAEDDGLAQRSSRLRCFIATETDALLSTIRSAAEYRTGPIKRIVTTRPSGKDSLTVLISPLCSEPSDEISACEVLVRVVVPERRKAINPSALAEMLQLTWSEAALCVALVQTGNLIDAAKACGLTIGSARQYLKRIFTKTNTSGQVALVSFILHLPLA